MIQFYCFSGFRVLNSWKVEKPNGLFILLKSQDQPSHELMIDMDVSDEKYSCDPGAKSASEMFLDRLIANGINWSRISTFAAFDVNEDSMWQAGDPLPRN